jgi:hypothetical protein
MKNNLSRKKTPSIQSVDRCLVIGEEVARSADPVSLRELVNLPGIDHSSVFRIANTLSRISMIGGGCSFGSLVTISNRLRAKPRRRRIREGKQALFIDHPVANSVIALTGQTGELIPLYCTLHR